MAKEKICDGQYYHEVITDSCGCEATYTFGHSPEHRGAGRGMIACSCGGERADMYGGKHEEQCAFHYFLQYIVGLPEELL